MPYLQGQAAQGPTRTYCGHTTLRAHPPWLPVHGTWERRECSSGNRPIHPVHQSLCYTIPDYPDDHQTLWDNFIVHYGLSKKILSNQGRNIEIQLVDDLCKLMGTQKLQTSPYHPQTNGQCERFNSTLIGMLGTLPPEKKSDWKNHIGTLVHAYYCTQNSATGFNPFYLMYERQPYLHVDVVLGLALHSVMVPTASKFVQKLREWVKWAHK